MKIQKVIPFASLVVGVLGLPGVLESIQSYAVLLDGWEWWNYTMVGGGFGGIIYWGYLLFKRGPYQDDSSLTDEQKFEMLKASQQIKHEIAKTLFKTDGGRNVLITIILVTGLVIIVNSF